MSDDASHIDDVPHIIAKLLEITKLSQTKLAKAVGVSQGTVSKWRSGEHGPTKAQWDRVRFFGRRRADTRHLFKDDLSADALLAGLDDDAKEAAIGVLKAHIAAVTRAR